MQLSHEIFNILKGANIKLKLFDPMGNKTLDPEFKTNVSMPITIPKTINNNANKALYSEAFNFSATFKPKCNPIIEPNNKNDTREMSIELNCNACPATTKAVINIVTNKEVPGINLVGIPIK